MLAVTAIPAAPDRTRYPRPEILAMRMDLALLQPVVLSWQLTGDDGWPDPGYCREAGQVTRVGGQDPVAWRAARSTTGGIDVAGGARRAQQGACLLPSW